MRLHHKDEEANRQQRRNGAEQKNNTNVARCLTVGTKIIRSLRHVSSTAGLGSTKLTN